LKQCWQSTPARLIKRLIMSMPQQMAACRKARARKQNTKPPVIQRTKNQLVSSNLEQVVGGESIAHSW
jgi:hypothetical protein